MIIVTLTFSKSSVFKMFSSTLKRKAGVLKFIWFGKRFREAPIRFRDGFARTVGLTFRNKAAFSNSSDIGHCISKSFYEPRYFVSNRQTPPTVPSSQK